MTAPPPFSLDLVVAHISNEFFLDVQNFYAHSGRVACLARAAFVLVCGRALSAETVEIARAMRRPPVAVARLRAQAASSLRVDAAFARRIAEIESAVAAMAGASAARALAAQTARRCRDYGAEADDLAAADARRFDRNAVDFPVLSAQLDLETLVLLDADRAAFRASADALRRMADAAVGPVHAVDLRRVATTLDVVWAHARDSRGRFAERPSEREAAEAPCET